MGWCIPHQVSCNFFVNIVEVSFSTFLSDKGRELQLCVFHSKKKSPGGHLSLLQWARENACPWNQDTCALAAKGGHLPLLQWARENGCPWDEYTCALAAKGGHLPLLKWARENGCPWNEETCGWALVKGHQEIFEWARANGAPWQEGTTATVGEAGGLLFHRT